MLQSAIPLKISDEYVSYTAALASLLFDSPEPQIIGKTQWIATFLLFPAPASSFFWLFLFSDFLSSCLLFSDSSPLLFHLSILSEVWLLNFLRDDNYIHIFDVLIFEHVKIPPASPSVTQWIIDVKMVLLRCRIPSMWIVQPLPPSHEIGWPSSWSVAQGMAFASWLICTRFREVLRKALTMAFLQLQRFFCDSSFRIAPYLLEIHQGTSTHRGFAVVHDITIGLWSFCLFSFLLEWSHGHAAHTQFTVLFSFPSRYLQPFCSDLDINSVLTWGIRPHLNGSCL